MANPFGAVVDNYYLDRLSLYAGEAKTLEFRAREALLAKQDFAAAAETYVRELKRLYGNGVTAHMMVYNATGDTLRLETYKEEEGHIGRTPYPLVIGNGQWASFLHVKPTSAALGSSGFLVYRGKNASGQVRFYLIGWRVPWKAFGATNSKVLCDVRRSNSFLDWDLLRWRLQLAPGRSATVEKEGGIIEMDIGTGTSPFCHAILSTPHTPRPS
ncbi:hypothetical protein KSS87_016834 [Heliosperma pusillum]|nr:hypothetical protein KSS87_016834 [Heliosperma pusillum]